MAYDPTGPAPQPPDPRAINGTPYNEVATWQQQQYKQAASKAKATNNMTVRTTSRPTPPIIRKGK